MNVDSFWAKVARTGGCWEWQAYRDPAGYGRFNVTPRKPALAHRVAWEIENGPIPDGLCVCHHCDNPPCVRPDHLFLGTARDNSDDKIAKGRAVMPPHRRGEAHPAVVATDEQVREARESYAAGREAQHEIAARLGVAQTLVSAWVRGRIRTEAGGPIVPGKRRRTRAEMRAAQQDAA